MKPISPLDVPALLRRSGLRPDKSLGQNFLTDATALERVVAAADLQPGDTVLEIGPGLGSLTRLLAARAGRVVAVELDGDLLAILRETLAGCDNVHLVQGDILALDPAALVAGGADEPGPYLVIANIPYYITSAVIRQLLECRRPPQRIVLTVQREVAERMCAGPGEMSLLAVSVQVYGRPQIASRIPAGAFYPPPKVDSAVIRVDRYATPRAPVGMLPAFFQLARAGFSQKRKTLRNSLAGGLGWPPARAADLLAAAAIDAQRRAETLSIDEWARLAECLVETQDFAPLPPGDQQHGGQEAQPGSDQDGGLDAEHLA